MTHLHTHDEERRIREKALDETLAATFPASDPPSSLPNPDDDSVDAVSTIDELDAPTRRTRPQAGTSSAPTK